MGVKIMFEKFIKLSRVEICVASLKANGASFFNGQLSHLYKLGDWKKADSWPMLKLFWSKSFKILF